MSSRGRNPVGLAVAPAGVVLRASRTLEGWLEVEMAEAGRLEPVGMVLAVGGGLDERAVASCCSRRALARRRLIS